MAAQRKVILVADLDPLMDRYHVVDEKGHELGEKNPNFGILKPTYRKDGSRNIGRWAGFDERVYRKTPPWFSCEVFRIDGIGYGPTIHVKKG